MASTDNERKSLVLIVDDDETVRILAASFLEEAGFTVEEASNGRQALAAFELLQPDVVLMDVMMPEMDGFEACEQLRRLPGGDRTPVVLLTGLEDIESINRAYEVGATDFMHKPINGLILIHRIRYILRANQNLQNLWRSEARLAHAQKIARLGNWDWDVEKAELNVSAQLARLLDMEPDSEITFDSMLSRVHDDDRAFVQDLLDAALHRGRPYNVNLRIVTTGGEERVICSQAEVSFDDTGKLVRVSGTMQDISEIERAQQKIQQLAYKDVLTNLPNRTLFRDRLSQALAYSRRHGVSFALMFLDIDRFKRINDTLGHDFGDGLLKSAAQRMATVVRENDILARHSTGEVGTTLARLGGDEFTILVTDLKYIQDAAKVARRILDVLSRPFNLNGHEVGVTASIGIAVYPTDGEDAETLLKHADTAMYHTKDQGRNNYHFFTSSMNASAFERLVLEGDLRRAMEGDELTLFYQPQVNLASARVTGVEALLRWRHPALGIVTPGKFLHIAEESGMLAAIDQWVLKEACTQSTIWRTLGLGSFRVAINLSNASFWRKDIVSHIRRTIRTVNMDPRQLELELTEGIVMEDAEEARRKFQELQGLGIRLSIDDFGTGYSSLSHLKRLPADMLKIDRSFVKDLPDDEEDAAICRAIIALARNLNKRVLAEGVETDRQFEFLRDSGCDEVQGYLFGRPSPPEAIPELLFRQLLPTT